MNDALPIGVSLLALAVYLVARKLKPQPVPSPTAEPAPTPGLSTHPDPVSEDDNMADMVDYDYHNDLVCELNGALNLVDGDGRALVAAARKALQYLKYPKDVTGLTDEAWAEWQAARALELAIERMEGTLRVDVMNARIKAGKEPKVSTWIKRERAAGSL
jgi:hypothetical protein